MTGTLLNVRQGLDSFVDWAQDPMPRIPLGLPFFDKATRGGIGKSECCMVLAYSSVGKTSLGLNWIANNPKVPTVFFSIEMAWRMVMSRLTAITSGVPTWELEESLRNKNTPQAMLDTAVTYPVLRGVDKSEISVKEMVQLVNAASDEMHQQVRLVIIDYLELIGGAGMLGKGEQVDKAAVKIRALAKDTDSSVVVLHQVGKGDGSDGFEPLSLDSGRYGGHQPFDYVIGMSAPRLNRKLTRAERADIQEQLNLQLLKNRGGMASPTPVMHHQDSTSRRISDPSVLNHNPSVGYQADLYSTPARPAPDLEFA